MRGFDIPSFSTKNKRGWFLQWRNAVVRESIPRTPDLTLSEYAERYDSAILKECLQECKTTDDAVTLYNERTRIQVPEPPVWLNDAYKDCKEKCKPSANFAVCLAECFDDKTYGIK
jgi:hypothetical protein